MRQLNLFLLTGFLCLFCLGNQAFAQVTQSIRGRVVDQDAKMPLTGVSVVLPEIEKAAFTDETGEFRIDDVPVGRHTLILKFVGYESLSRQNIVLNSGKELVLNLEMRESILSTDEVLISGAKDKKEALNEMATVSARAFSVDETQRYAAAAYDPARMALSYAGVTGGGDDLTNEIVIRGNSPRGIMWRLEGIEVPSPNHFGSMGNSGGAISMLSSSTLTNSDFYTGAFPSEYGNALSGVFDLKMRNGNNEKREYALMVGLLGIEAAAEGPFSKNSKASYLINYRYSTLAALQATGFNPTGDLLPTYSDLSFKIHVPTQKYGNFSLFGIGGINDLTEDAEADSNTWDGWWDGVDLIERQQTGIVGLSHNILLSNKTYLKTVAAASFNRFRDEYQYLNPEQNYEPELFDDTRLKTHTYRLSTQLNHKFDARNTLRAGAIVSYMGFDFLYDAKDLETDEWTNFIDNEGNTQYLQAYTQWKHRLSDKLTLNAGFHANYLLLNDAWSLEPRAAISWQMNDKQALSFAAGLHSKLEHISTYFIEERIPNEAPQLPNHDLELSKAAHIVLGYDHSFTPNLRLKVETYYQHLYDIPEAADTSNLFSMTNAAGIWDIGSDSLVSTGRGRNIGIDLTLEKFFTHQYYFLITGSLYDSRFEAPNGKWFNTRYNGQYSLNVLGGKEFTLGKKNNKTLGLNAKFVLTGGNRATPIDLIASREEGYVIHYRDRLFEDRTGPYYRFDIGLRYKINAAKVTHSFMIDVQNVSNRQNIYSRYYNNGSGKIEESYQTGLLPFVNYRIEF